MKYNLMLVAGSRYQGKRCSSEKEYDDYLEGLAWLETLKPIKILPYLGCAILELTEEQAAELLLDPRVLELELEKPVQASVVQLNASWHLSTIAGTTDNTYPYERSGKGVIAYVFDQAINPRSSEFSYGAEIVFDAYPDMAHGDDHGHIVSSLLGGLKYGVAKDVTIKNLRVLAPGSTTLAVIDAVNWVLTNHPVGVPAVMNLSLGSSVTAGSPTTAMEHALLAAIADGFIVVAAAGNEGTPCNIASPARLAGVITAGAIGQTKVMPSWSNYGPEVDLLAPGDLVHAEGYDGQIYVAQGTSMSAPIVAGIVACYLQTRRDAGNTEVRRELLGQSYLTAATHEVTRANTTLDISSSNIKCRWLGPTGQIKNFSIDRDIVLKPYYMDGLTPVYLGEYHVGKGQTWGIANCNALPVVTNLATSAIKKV